MKDEAAIDQMVADHIGIPVGKQLMTAAREGNLCISGQANGNGICQLEGHEQWFKEPIGHWNGLLYFQRCWILESRIVHHLKRLLIDVKQLDMTVAGLNVKQMEGVKKGLGSSVFCLTGGPGTGKTHTVVELVKGLQAQGGEVIATAPTGKAVAQLRSRLDNVKSGTLHQLLGVRDVKDVVYGTERKLNAEMIVVDECSMIDAGMWGTLLAAVPTGSRLILVGDHDQLPPVEAGTVYGEICGWMKEQHPQRYVHLDVCMRSDRIDILDLAQRVKEGKQIAANELDKQFSAEKWKNRFQGPTKKWNREESFAKLNSFRILSCLREGPFGINQINQEFFNLFNKEFHRGDVWPIPIMVTKTSYDWDVYNGDMGILIKHSSSSLIEEGDMAYFGDKEVPAALLPAFEYAYALSVHKSQGSEYDEVAFFVPKGSEVFGKEILYTGITRAKKSLKIYANKESLQSCLACSMQKLSGIRKKLTCFGI